MFIVMLLTNEGQLLWENYIVMKGKAVVIHFSFSTLGTVC